MTDAQASSRQGAPRITILGRKFRVPSSPYLRLLIGGLLVFGGMFGFLPVLGFWMIPVGFVILSVDLPSVRRRRRRAEVWLGRKANGIRGNGNNRRGQ